VALGLAITFALGCASTSQPPGGSDAGAIGGSAAGSGGTGAVGGGGASGQAGAAGGQGGSAPVCGSAPTCAADARRCGADGVPEICVTRPGGCRGWEATAACSAHQGCTDGTCTCANDERCGAAATEGDFCPTPGAPTFGHCAADADGCLFVSAASNGCAQGQTCRVVGIVETGTACGCPANGATLGTGCADRTLAEQAPDADGGVILSCAQIGACQMWKVISDCGSQGLAAGLLSGKPACVCAEPAGHLLYVDPAPGVPAQPVGPPTGAKSPAACRLPSITSALAKAVQKTAFTSVVATHATTPVHLGVATGEAFPLVLPAGVTVTSDDGAGLDPSHYIFDVKGVTAPGPAVVLGDGAAMAGFTIDAGGPAGTVNAGTNVSNVVVCAQASKASSATLDHMLVRGQTGMTGIAVNGACALVATSCGISGATIGIDVARTSMGATDTASLTATDLAIASMAQSSIGMRVGTGVESGLRSSVMVTGGIIGTSGSGLVVTGGTAQFTNTSIAFTATTAGSQNRGLLMSGGKVTLDGGGITMGDVTGTNAIGVEITGGTAILKGVAIVGVRHVTGVQIAGASDVTVSGSVSGKARIATTMPAATGDPSEGLVVVAGATAATVKLHGSVEVSGFRNGVVLNDGTLTTEPGDAGEVVAVLNNRNDGLQVLGTTANHAVSLTGSTFRDNAGRGLIVRTIAPVVVQGCTVSGNGSDGIDLQRTQANTQTMMHLTSISGSTVSGNAGHGIALSGKGEGAGALAGGKVGAALTGNMVSLNGGVGIFVSEASDAADGDDITEAWIEGNDVGGNLTTSTAAGIIAGGVFFASADVTTRIQLRSFFGNRIHGNGFSEVGFNLIQNDTLPWNLSSHAADAGAVCSDVSTPNFIYCYGSFSNDYAIAVTGTSIHLMAKGIHFQNAPAIAGLDLSPGIPATEFPNVCAPQTCQ